MHHTGSIAVNMLPHGNLLVAKEFAEGLKTPYTIVGDTEPELGERNPHFCRPSPVINFCCRKPYRIPGVILHPAVL